MSDNRVTVQQKKAVFERAKGCCEYCRSQARFAIQPFSIEHIIPRSQGGKTSLDNLALSCQGCNNHKYNKTEGRDILSENFVSLYHPRQQRWSEHFAWNDYFTVVIGLTPTGRATVETLQLNREGVVNLRRVLYDIGEHPPAESDN
ncbi:restriction endonuclease [Cylindrospermum stagnale PCC 7417]|uniref:Restriction endonuclease n=1 Tax=Cylindrospermum stagnale PCC 7417 TaxID=56107 RepID=K9WV69_9NOST|nr:HNH endonuclease signature motif containing protein [Cylindrospermum stagnale]AFZ23417.1 restriction endonuclease [Cylindrospermum stagnale PCC 7417]